MDLSFYEHLRPKAKVPTATATGTTGAPGTTGTAGTGASVGGDRDRGRDRDRDAEHGLDDVKEENSHDSALEKGQVGAHQQQRRQQPMKHGTGLVGTGTGKDKEASQKEKETREKQSRSSLIFGIGRVQDDSHSLSSYQALIERQKQGKAINFSAAQRLNKGTELTTADTVLAMCPKDVDKPFKNLFDACDRLYPYHAMYEEDFPASASGASQQQQQQPQEESARAPRAPPAKGEGEREGHVHVHVPAGNKVSLPYSSPSDPVAYWARWDAYCSGQAQFMGKKTQLLEERYEAALQKCATEKALDAFQVEHLYLKDATRKIRKLNPKPQPPPPPPPQSTSSPTPPPPLPSSTNQQQHP